MRKMILLLSAAVFLNACSAGAEKSGDAKSANQSSASTVAKPQAGETVLFKTGAVNYAEGKVEKVEGGKYEIRSKDSITRPDASDVYRLPEAGAKTDAKPGEFVVAFNYEIYWEGGEVKNVSDDVIEVEKATGGKLTVAPDKIIRVSPAAVAVIKQQVQAKAFEDAGKQKKPVLPPNWKPKSGEKVAAQWTFGTWHIAVIKHVNPNNIDIDWQNGWSDGTVALDKVAPYPTAANPLPNAGDYIIIKPQNDSSPWTFAVVTATSGQEIEAKLADGKTQKVRNTDFIAMK